MIWVMGEKKRGVVVGGNGVEESSRMKMVEVWKGGELKRVEEREASVAEKRWVMRSKMASWWMSLWMCGTSDEVARRTRAKSG